MRALCVLLLAALAWGQSDAVPPDAPVITLNGFCKAPAGKNSPNCNIVITRAEFERLVKATVPNLPESARRQYAEGYISALNLTERAHEMGLDRGAEFETHMNIARIQVLADEFGRALENKAQLVPDGEIQSYYQKNRDSFEETEFSRIYVPNIQQLPTPKQKLSEADQQKRTQESKDRMKAEADSLQARAVSGEDFGKLQTEAFQLADIPIPNPTTSLGKIKKDGLPPSHRSVMNLKVGQISPVVSDDVGYYIYRVDSRATASLEEVRDQVIAALRQQNLQNELEALQSSTKISLEDGYFGPANESDSGVERK